MQQSILSKPFASCDTALLRHYFQTVTELCTFENVTENIDCAKASDSLMNSQNKSDSLEDPKVFRSMHT